MLRLAGLLGVLLLFTLPAAATAAAAEPTAGEPSSPCPFPLTRENRPVAPKGAPPDVATFTDPTVEVEGAEDVRVAEKDYLGPFARLLADDGRICIEEGSNVHRSACDRGGGGALLDHDDLHEWEIKALP